MNELFQNLDSLLRSTPSALLTYFNSEGEGRVRTAEWVGVICSEPALLTVCLKRSPERFGEVLGEREFVVNLPSAAQLSALPTIVREDRTGSPIPAALMTVREAAMISAPFIADSPIRIECRKGSALFRFDREVISTTIAAVHVGERIYGRDAPPDIYRLAPFTHPLIACRASERNMEGAWRNPSHMPENSSCF